MHRDLATRNVLVFSYDAAAPPLVKVSDFGLTQGLTILNTGIKTI